jgi:hypothetical protein
MEAPHHLKMMVGVVFYLLSCSVVANAFTPSRLVTVLKTSSLSAAEPLDEQGYIIKPR